MDHFKFDWLIKSPSNLLIKLNIFKNSSLLKRSDILDCFVCPANIKTFDKVI